MKGHQMQTQDTTPAPLCHCGCGATTKRQMKVKGKPFSRYALGHNSRKIVDRIRIDNETGCHIWQGALNTGYGKITVDGYKTYVHIYYYEEKYGPVPDTLELDHLCGVRACCNPDHLEPVTHTENMRRSKVTKLTFSSAQEIKVSDEPSIILAEQYGTSVSNIYAIRQGRTWRDA